MWNIGLCCHDWVVQNIWATWRKCPYCQKFTFQNQTQNVDNNVRGTWFQSFSHEIVQLQACGTFKDPKVINSFSNPEPIGSFVSVIPTHYIFKSTWSVSCDTTQTHSACRCDNQHNCICLLPGISGKAESLPQSDGVLSLRLNFQLHINLKILTCKKTKNKENLLPVISFPCCSLDLPSSFSHEQGLLFNLTSLPGFAMPLSARFL